MAEKSKWQQHAATRLGEKWTYVDGDGPICVTDGRTMTYRLFSFYLLAKTYQNEAPYRKFYKLLLPPKQEVRPVWQRD